MSGRDHATSVFGGSLQCREHGTAWVSGCLSCGYAQEHDRQRAAAALGPDLNVADFVDRAACPLCHEYEMAPGRRCERAACPAEPAGPKPFVSRELARPEWRADLNALFDRWQALPPLLQRGTIIYLFGGLGVYDRTELGLAPELLLRAIEASEKEAGR